MIRNTNGVNPMVLVSADNQHDLLKDLETGVSKIIADGCIDFTVQNGNIVVKLGDLVLCYHPYADPASTVYFATVIKLAEGFTIQLSFAPKYALREVMGMPVSYNSLGQMFDVSGNFVGLGTEEFTKNLRLDDKLEADEDEEYTFYATDNVVFQLVDNG